VRTDTLIRIAALLGTAFAACFIATCTRLPLSAAAQAGAGEYDVLLKNGHIIDGTGNPWVSGNVAIRSDRIAVIGKVDDSHAKRVIDATGLIISPGFIDMLGQSEVALLIDNRSLSKLAQGITTESPGKVDRLRHRPNSRSNHFNHCWTTTS
jgi:N-acyl-D-amino-acid deacylase